MAGNLFDKLEPRKPTRMICVIDEIVELTASAIESREEDFEKIVGL
jgi:hypothetical protein